MNEKLSCGIIRDLLPPVIDDVAGEESKAAVEEHLAVCPECALLYAQLKQADPLPAMDEQDALHFRRAMKRTRRRGLVLKIIAGVMAAALLLCGITVACNPQMLLAIDSEVPVAWMQDAHLVRTKENIVLLRFKPSERYRAFFGVVQINSPLTEVNADEGVDWTLHYGYPLLARLLNLDLKCANNKAICLENGDRLVPLDIIGSAYYDETDNSVVYLDTRDATAEEMRALMEDGVAVTGSTQITAIDQEKKTASLTLSGPDGQITVYHRGEDIPLLDEKSQALVTQAMKHAPDMFEFPGNVTTY